MTICYFTATGNSLYVAKRISGKLLSIPKLMRDDDIFIEDDVVGVVAPVYAVEMPMMVKDFIEKAKIKTDYFFFIYTYGSGFAEAFTQVYVESKKVNLPLKYINAVIMVDNYIPFFDMDEQVKTLPKKHVEEQIDKIVIDIKNKVENVIVPTDKNREEMNKWHNTHATNILKKDTAKFYTVSEDCVKCKICEKVCPANNIKVDDSGVHFYDRCEVCYACLHNCPKNAIHMSVEKNTVRYRNDHITLKEIIDSNE